MLPDSLIDSCMPFLPNVKAVTVYATRDATAKASPYPLQARKEPATEEMKAMAGLEGGTEACVFFIPAGQAGFVRPRNNWLVVATGFDGQEWVVKKDDLGIQERGVAVLCSLKPE